MRAPDVSKRSDYDLYSSFTSNSNILPWFVEIIGTDSTWCWSRYCKSQIWGSFKSLAVLKLDTNPIFNWLWKTSQKENPIRFISWRRTTYFYAYVLHVLYAPTAGIHTSMQSIDFKPTVGLLIGKCSCSDTLNHKVSFQMHHHNVLSTEKSLLAVPNFRTSCPCPWCTERLMCAVNFEFFPSQVLLQS